MTKTTFPRAAPRMIVEWYLGHWSAWFEDSPQVAYGGDTPNVAAKRLYRQWQKERFVKAAKQAEGSDQ